MYQYGGRNKIGTMDALTHVWTNILHNTAKFKETNVIFLDISKAFDRLIRELIIWKLKYVCDLSEPLIMWVHNFLLNRKQRIKIWGSTSVWKTTKSGGPQGCVLTPVLFALYICNAPLDISQKCVNTRAAKFVDDICCYSTGECNNQISDLNKRMNEIYNWSNQWGVDFNVKKCKMITFTKNKKELTKCDRTVTMGNKTIETTSEYKYLGLVFNENLNFDNHIEQVLKKCNKLTYVLNKLAQKSQYGKRLFSKMF